MRLRRQIEQREDESLAPFALRASRSVGRLHEEADHPYRTPFQRDRDRILHARAFRRLQHKTQVFPLPQGDHYRNRLSHTLEVAQIARTVARALGINEDLTEAIVLAHDLGHPPFGHAGERLLHDLARAYGGFEHNRQSLRTVDFIELRTDEYPGLNLTHETRAGLLKHGAEFPKYGHAVPLPTLSRQASAEAQVANLADEIAYHSHDIDDGLRAGLLAWDELCELELFSQALTHVREQGVRDPTLQRRRVIAAVIDLAASDLIRTSGDRLAASGVRSPEEVLAASEALVAFSPQMREGTRSLARFLLHRFYRHPDVLRMVEEAEHVLRDLWFVYNAEPSHLPAELLERGAAEPTQRAIVDYVAGMTDRFAMEERERLVR
jgi:dGTPase